MRGVLRRVLSGGAISAVAAISAATRRGDAVSCKGTRSTADAPESIQADLSGDSESPGIDDRLSIPIENRCDLAKVERALLRWYSCQASNSEGESMLSPEVTFEDPVWRLDGPDEFLKGMEVLAMVLPYSEIDDYKWWTGRGNRSSESGALDSARGLPTKAREDSSRSGGDGDRSITSETADSRPDEATLWLRARYGFMSSGAGPQLPLQTGIRVRLDGECRLCRVEDCWNGVALPSRHQAGIFGAVVEGLRIMNGGLACRLAGARAGLEAMRGEPPEGVLQERRRLAEEAEGRLAASVHRVQARNARERAMEAAGRTPEEGGAEEALEVNSEDGSADSAGDD